MGVLAARVAYLATCAVVVGGCATAPTIDVRHDPAYRAEAHTAGIAVTAKSERGIDRITVELLTGRLVACQQGDLPSIFPCREGGYWQVFTCEFGTHVPPNPETAPAALVGGALALPKTAVCPVSQDLAALSLLSYRATAVDGAGRATSTNFITFSGGSPPIVSASSAERSVGPVASETPSGVVVDMDSIGDLELPPPGPTAADVMRPIWLEAEADPSYAPLPRRVSFDMAQRIDVVFMPDADWDTNYRGFSDATGHIASTVLFAPLYNNPVPTYAEDYKQFRHEFTYWVGPAGASTPGQVCSNKTFAGWAVAAQAATDGQDIVHQVRFQDCATRAQGGSGTTWEAMYKSAYTFVHESGHFLHCMGDEYSKDGYTNHGSCSNPLNTFASENQCQQTATEYGYPASWCMQIEFSPWWRISRAPAEDMDIMDGVTGNGHRSLDAR